MSRIKRINFRVSKPKYMVIRRPAMWYDSITRVLKIRIRRFHKPKHIINLIDYTMDQYENKLYRLCHLIANDDKRFNTYEKIIEFAINKYGLRKYINKMEDDSWKENLIQKHKEMKERNSRGKVIAEIPLEKTEKTTKSLVIREL